MGRRTMASMPGVLFLDFDGVLNTDSSRREHGFDRLDPERVERVNRIVERTGCTVVVSSSWRIMEGPAGPLTLLLRAAGARFDVAGVTPWERGRDATGIWLPYVGRGAEIEEWLNETWYTGPFAIVDDDDDMTPVTRPHHVKTDDETGLLDEHVERLCALL